ncbi:MAG: magnesium transporter [Actinomycetota bacterium]|nr:magnesium transporter [Actinomycetota bacterium]
MQVRTFDGRTSTQLDLDPAPTIQSISAAGFRWIDIRADGPADPAVASLLTGWGFSTSDAAYVMRSHSAGVFEVKDGRVVGTTWVAADGASMLSEVHFSWSPQVLITVRFGGDAAVAGVTESVARSHANLFDEPTTAFAVVLQLFLGSVNSELTALGEQLDTLDGAIIEEAHPRQLTELRDLRGLVIPMSRRFEPYADEVSQALVDPTGLPGMDSAGVAHLQAYSVRLGDVVTRIGDLTDQLRDCAQDFQTEVGNQQGNRINQLTIVSIVFLPITFLTGYFGMNFQWLGNETMSFASWLLLGVVMPLLVVVASIVVLTNRGYLRRRADRQRVRDHNDTSES